MCLQFKPQLIAAAAIYLASKFLKYPLPEEPRPWWEVFNAKIADLEGIHRVSVVCNIGEEISNQILDLYESPGSLNVNSNPTRQVVEKEELLPSM